MAKSDLPFGSEFSPQQVDLPSLLECAVKHGGDWKGFENAVFNRYFAGHNTSEYNQRKLANNTKLSMVAYGLIDRDAALTALGRELHDLRKDESRLHQALAKHILVNLNGSNLVQCIRDMQAAGEKVSLLSLRRWMGERGIQFPRGGKHRSVMRLWLEKAGVFVDGWRVDGARLRTILGVATDEIEALANLTPEQRAYLQTLVNLGGSGPYPSNDVERMATATYGVHFNEKNLPKRVLYPLETAGYITLTRGTKATGRGAKPFMVTPTRKLVTEVVGPLLEQIERQTASDIRPLLRKPLDEILREMDSADRHLAGLALEALAFRLMRLINLTYVATRLRGVDTGGAEADLIFESDRLVFSRWQIQCKNAERVRIDDVAKQVGLTHTLRGSVIVIISAGEIGYDARQYARFIETARPVRIVMLDRQALDRIAGNPAALVDEMNTQSNLALVPTEGFSFLLRKTDHDATPSLAMGRAV